ncbi:uncharacterized protein LOC114839776 [Esox lucius]|uniref:uncharacterized protein LOC114839776 n=1 Tax=Esox lucius TaxID=8010 RepID=UPI001476E715|nr:uncharacterized protein LOC114839776 [Esox lucius]
MDPGLRSQEEEEIVVGQFKEEVNVVVEEGIKEEVDEVVEEGIKEEVDEVVEEGIKEEVDEVVEEGIKEEVDEMVEEGIKEEVDDVQEEDIKEEVDVVLEEGIEEVYEMVDCDLTVEPLLIPLEPLISDVSLRDPRHALQVDLTLPRPAFALDVLWSPEDLAPVPPLPHRLPVPCTSPKPCGTQNTAFPPGQQQLPGGSRRKPCSLWELRRESCPGGHPRLSQPTSRCGGTDDPT